MNFDIPEPCSEPWETMEIREGGRFCARCKHVVTDLTGMTRRQAEKIVKRAADDLCIQIVLDADDRAVFRPPPIRAPHWAGGVVLTAALTAGGCDRGAPPPPPTPVLAPLNAEPTAPPPQETAELPDTPDEPAGPRPAPELTAEDRFPTGTNPVGNQVDMAGMDDEPPCDILPPNMTPQMSGHMGPRMSPSVRVLRGRRAPRRHDDP